VLEEKTPDSPHLPVAQAKQQSVQRCITSGGKPGEKNLPLPEQMNEHVNAGFFPDRRPSIAKEFRRSEPTAGNFFVGLIGSQCQHPVLLARTVG